MTISVEYGEIVSRIVLAASPGDEWQFEEADPWLRVSPPEVQNRLQGWKVHLSATPGSAAEVLRRAVPVLVLARCPFKLACSAAEVATLNGRNADRGSSGKFMTVYPSRDEDVPGLVRALHAATAGLPGPRILSDRPYAAGSLVHYRYGAFRLVRRLAPDGTYEAVLATPDGGYVMDRREAWFTPPAWAPPDPLLADRPSDSTVDDSASSEVLLDGRFALRSAIRHANKGGVFRATDRQTGGPVVVKQGRRHVAVQDDGSDIRDRLRNEAVILRLLADSGMTPRPVALIERDDHTFLVEESIDGIPLWQHVTSMHRGGAAAVDTLIELALGVAELVERAHGAGVVIRDLTPSNILVCPDRTVRLVDLEMAAPVGASVLPGGSPGYAAPEQWTARAAEPEVDLRGLGAVLFFLFTGVEPVFAPDEPDDRSQQDRMAEWLDRAGAANPAAEVFTDVVLALADPLVTRRWPLPRVRAALRQRPSHAGRGTVADEPVEDAERLLADGLTYLTSTVAEFTGAASRWPTDAAGVNTDFGNVYYGAAGVLTVLAEALMVQPTAEIRDAVLHLHSRLDSVRCPDQPVVQGLLFGRPGTLYSLLNAADALGDETAVSRVADEFESLPLSSAVPDVAHGLAGTGLTLLRFWRRTGRDVFLDRAVQVASELAMSAEYSHDGGVGWQVPALSSRRPRPVRQYGFAHGTAGIATFLLDVGRAAGAPEFVDVARVAGDTLCAAVQRTSDGAARWTAGPDRELPLAGWCSGAAGVGGFLLRLWQATGVADYLATATDAAVAVHHDRWLAPAGYCHGAAGGADYLVDLARATGDHRYSSWALEMTAPLMAHAARRGELLLTPDSGGREVSAGWATGTAGVVGVLLRIRSTARPSWFFPTGGPVDDQSGPKVVR